MSRPHAATLARALPRESFDLGTLAPMSDSPEQTKDRRGFSSRWMLDGERRAAPTATIDASSAVRAVDTDRDGVADTYAVRVDSAPRPSAMRSLGAWTARSIAIVLFAAALVAAGVAATYAFGAREDRSAAQAELTVVEADLAEARAEVDSLRDDLLAAREESSNTTVDVNRLETEREELQLEVTVLRRMLLDAEQRASER